MARTCADEGVADTAGPEARDVPSERETASNPPWRRLVLLVLIGTAVIATSNVAFRFARHGGLITAYWEGLIVLALSVAVFLPLVVLLLRDFGRERLRAAFLFVIVCLTGDLALDFTEEIDALDDVWLVGNESRLLDRARDVLGVAAFVGLGIGVYLLTARLAAVQRDQVREAEEKAHLRRLVAMDRVHQRIVSATCVEAMLGGVLDELLEVLGADRAWLCYPCAPEASSVCVPIERTRAGFAGLGGTDAEIPIEVPLHVLLEEVGRVGEPLVRCGADVAEIVGPDLAERLQIRGLMAVAIRPRTGPLWALGLHRCAHEREWTDGEKRLLTEIGRRVEDALTTWLAMRELSESESRWRALFEHAPEALVILDAESGRFVDVNQNAVDLFGRDREALAEVGPVEISAPVQANGVSSAELVRELNERTLAGETPLFEWKFVDAAGREVLTEVRLFHLPATDRQLIRGSITDIGDRKAAEQALEQYGRQQTAVARLGQLAVGCSFALDELFDSAVRTIADTLDVKFCKVLELLPGGEELRLRAGVGWQEGLVGSATVGAQLDSQAGYTLAAGEPVLVDDLPTETRFNGPELLHEHGVVSGISVAIIGEHEAPFGVLGAHSRRRRQFSVDDVHFLQSVAHLLADAIARRSGELALRESEDRYRNLLESHADAVGIQIDGTIAYANERLCELTGYSRDELMGIVSVELLVPQDRERAAARGAEVLAGGPPSVREYELARKDGCVLPIDVLSRAIHHDGKAALLTVLRDITSRKRAAAEAEESKRQLERTVEELRRTQEEVIQKERLWALGHLASGVAHDFNNFLTVVLGNASLLRSSPDRHIARPAEQICNAATRAAALTRQLLAFSRKQVFELEDVDLRSVAIDAFELVRHLVKEDIELVFSQEEDDSSLPVRVDVAQLNQVIMNLAVNARDAMPLGGVLTVTVSLEKAGDDDRGARGVIAVSDSGAGIPAEILPQIFEPFFTTKSSGQGTGLGLSMAHGTIEQLGGKLSVESQVGRGTTFRIALPLLEDSRAPASSAREVTRGSRGREGDGETILVVDDDVQVRSLVCEVLSQSGYEVLGTDCPREALELSGSHDGAIDLLVTDVVMPGASGPELAQRLRQHRPRTRTLFMSGYPDGYEETVDVDSTDPSQFLQKPFGPSELLDRVRALLDSLPAESESPSETSAVSQTVFLIDDSEDVRNTVESVVEAVGVRCRSFATARDFLRVDEPMRSGCVLLDVELPDMSGLELLKKLRSLGVALPVIIVSDHGDTDMAVIATKLGAFDFVRKPFDGEDLLRRIRQALASAPLAATVP